MGPARPFTLNYTEGRGIRKWEWKLHAKEACCEQCDVQIPVYPIHPKGQKFTCYKRSMRKGVKNKALEQTFRKLERRQ